jgi:hypothetical protein
MLPHCDTYLRVKPALDAESPSGVAIYRRLGRLVYEWDDGESWTVRGLSAAMLSHASQDAANRGYKLRGGYGCCERWTR